MRRIAHRSPVARQSSRRGAHALGCLLLLAACGDDAAAIDAAPPGRDAGPVDAAAVLDATAPLSWVDFTITGCAEMDGPVDGGEAPCVGPAPLGLRFTPIAPAPVDVYLWRFAEPGRDAGPTSSERAPAEVFALPGTYGVSLDVQGPGGTAGVSKPGIVEVVPAPLGSRCAVAEQCAAGECVCAGGSCADIEAGLCAGDCAAAGDCGPGGACAVLDPAGGDAPWQRSLCVADCAAGTACPEGLSCQSLRDPDGAWVRGCFAPGVLGGFGDTCADTSGALVDARCASGVCAAVGERGLCTADCSETGCPADAACATFAEGPLAAACVARCSAVPCDGDPGLGCAAPGDRFAVDDAAADPAGYCVPL